MEMTSSDEDWSDVEEDVHSECRALCLFCNEAFEKASACLGHIVEVHNFDIIAFCRVNGVDFYGFIRLVNYIRESKVNVNDAHTLKKEDFENEMYLKPVVEDDGMLQIDFDELIVKSVGMNGNCSVQEEKRSLEENLKIAETRAFVAEESLTRAVQDLEKCKAEMQQLIFQKSEDSESQVMESGESSSYFESYSHHGIHDEMLKDRVRTEAYRDFILSNKGALKDKIVLDVGCGTGVLSMFAAKAGAKMVIAVDQSDIVYQAMDIVKENKLDGVIKIIKGDAEKLILPEGVTKVDVIISEWMGYFLLFESMLDTVLKCRDKYLGKEGMVYPDCCSMHLAAVSDEKTWDSKIGFWDDVYGYKMSCMKSYVIEEAIIDVLDKDVMITKPTEIMKYDLMNATVKDLEFEADFKLIAVRDGVCTGIVGHFDVGFQKNLSFPIYFSTGCKDVPTHWKQTLFLFERKIEVKTGEVLVGNIICKKDRKDKRALIVKLQLRIENKSSQAIRQTYTLN